MARRLLFLTMYLLLWLPAAAETGRAPLYIVNGVVRTTVSDIPEKNIENIVVEDCEIVSVKGADLRYANGVVLKNVDITQSEGNGYVVANSMNVRIIDCSDASGAESPDVFLHNSHNVTID